MLKASLTNTSTELRFTIITRKYSESFIEFNNPQYSCQFVDPFTIFTRLSKNSSECGSISSCILASLYKVY